LQAIVVNYFTACLLGATMYDAPIVISEITVSKWFVGAIVLGFLFISVFNVMALTAQRNGLSVASVASKMSVIIPIVFGLYAYQESLGIQKVIGIILALIAVYLTSIKPKENQDLKKGLLLPILLFFGSGIIDTSIKYLETTYVAKNGIPIFSATIFAIAFILGLGLITIQIIRKQFKPNPKSLIGGSILGVVNYCSIYYLLKALQFEGFESSTIFTINNVAIVMISTLTGLVLFKERIFKMNWL
jgi:drug/metabolite transporter (DMT)-like permease